MSTGAELPGAFDPTSVPATMSGGNGLPISDKNGHLVVITESEFKPNNAGTGHLLKLNLHIQEGPAIGQDGDWNLNLGHPTALTCRIAQQELSCICSAVGHVGPIQNVGVIHNKPFRIVVQQQKKNPEYTEVVKVLRADGSKLSDPPGSSGVTVAGTSPPPPPQATGGNVVQQPPPVQPLVTPTGFPAVDPVQPPLQPNQPVAAVGQPVTPVMQQPTMQTQPVQPPIQPVGQPPAAPPAGTMPWIKQPGQ